MTSSGSGYFTSVVDGYETELNLDNIGSLTVTQIKNIIQEPVKTTASHKNAIG